MLDHVAPVAAALAIVLAMAGDLRRRIIPNILPVAIVAVWGVDAALARDAAHGVAGLVTGTAALAAGATMFARGWLGGGDVKLFAAIACWGGPAMLLPFALLTSLIGAVVALATLAVAGLPRTGIAVPYGVAIGSAGLLVLAHAGG